MLVEERRNGKLIARIGIPWSTAARLLFFRLVLNGPILVSWPPYWRLLSGWISFSHLAVVDPAGLSLSYDSVGEQKIMDQESTQLCMRAFRVFSLEGSLYHKWLILEDVAHAQFRCVGYSASKYRPTKKMKATLDPNDAWRVLNALRDAALIAERGSFHQITADSIDTAIAQAQTEWQELQNLKSQAMTSTSLSRGDEPTGTAKPAKPMTKVIRGSKSSEQELKQMIDDVWGFAAGLHLEWRTGSLTPAGHDYEVLSFDGSEKVLVHPTSVEIPSRSK